MMRSPWPLFPKRDTHIGILSLTLAYLTPFLGRDPDPDGAGTRPARTGLDDHCALRHCTGLVPQHVVSECWCALERASTFNDQHVPFAVGMPAHCPAPNANHVLHIGLWSSHRCSGNPSIWSSAVRKCSAIAETAYISHLTLILSQASKGPGEQVHSLLGRTATI